MSKITGPDFRVRLGDGASRGASSDATAAARYRSMEAARQPYLDRARQAAELTIPSLMPPEGHSGASDLATPYQGVGARGVNNLSNKFLLAQFPPNAPFFRLAIDDIALEKAIEDPAAKSEAQTALARIERAISREIETGFLRVGLHAALKQLIVAGNVLLHLPPEGGMRVFRLDRYVVSRDPMGAVREIVVRETVSPETLPETVPDSVRAAVSHGLGRGEKTVELYTHIRRDDRLWRVHQEINGEALPGSSGAYALDKLEWLALRWSHVDGEDYGRGHVEEYLGDLRSLEGLMRAIVEGSAIASKVTVLVAPNGQTDAEELAEAENGAIIDGSQADIGVVQAGRMNDFRVAFETVKMITERLAFAFLLNSAVARDADRVTAEEIRFMAGELEDALGGVYSVLSQELQLPLVAVLMHHKAQAGLLPTLPSKLVKPMITTGLDALGRGHDFAKLQGFLAFAQQMAALEAAGAGKRLDLDDLMRRGAASIGVDASGLLLSKEAREAEEAEATAAANPLAGLAESLTPEMIQQIAGALGGVGGEAAAQA